MRIILFISEAIVPLLFATVILYGFASKTDIYDAFVEGAMDGVKTVAKILPTLIGLMTAVGIFSGSGALNAFTKLISPVTDALALPKEAPPVILMRLVSSSASVGLILDIFKNAGPDSFAGRYVSVLMSCTETVFYTMAVYFMSVRITKTRHTLFCAVAANLCGAAISLWVTRAAFY